jgi:hypothetical protein
VFKVIALGFSQEFERWTDALETANSLKPSLKRWTNPSFVTLRVEKFRRNLQTHTLHAFGA